MYFLSIKFKLNANLSLLLSPSRGSFTFFDLFVVALLTVSLLSFAINLLHPFYSALIDIIAFFLMLLCGLILLCCMLADLFVVLVSGVLVEELQQSTRHIFAHAKSRPYC